MPNGNERGPYEAKTVDHFLGALGRVLSRQQVPVAT